MLTVGYRMDSEDTSFFRKNYIMQKLKTLKPKQIEQIKEAFIRKHTSRKSKPSTMKSLCI